MADTYVYPSDIFAAVEEAKRRNPKDTNGDSAFEVDIRGQIREGKNNVRYVSFKVLKYNKNSKQWEYSPLIMKFASINTTSNIYPPGNPKKRYAGVRLQFTNNKTIFTRKVKTGKSESTITENYGAAMMIIYAAFSRIVKSMLKRKLINNGNTKIASVIQTEIIIDSKSGVKKKMNAGEEIIRVDVPFNKIEEGGASMILPGEKPKCAIFDLTRKESNPEPGDLPLKKGTFLNSKKVEVEITYSNIHEYITYGSVCSGLCRMDSVCFSSQGISLPCKIDILVVKRSTGRIAQATSVFGSSELEEMEGVETIDEEESDQPNDEETKTSDFTEVTGDDSAIIDAIDDMKDEFDEEGEEVDD